jgi:hypothetical protein
MGVFEQVLQSYVQEAQFSQRNTGFTPLRPSKGKRSMVRILWGRFAKSRQPLDLPKKQGGYGHVRSSSSRDRESLDR